MILTDIVNRNIIPHTWGEGDHFPWDDPHFSEKMLIEHLNQNHDFASRRFEIIDRHVDWIHRTLLSGKQTKILDLGCGPGFYTSRLAQLGHECVGIDFSPAAIAYARKQAQQENNSRCTYIEQDMYSTAYGSGYGLIMMLSGVFNTLNPMDVYEFFGKAWMALDEDGMLLIEPQTLSSLKKTGKAEPTWYSAKEGLFSDTSHLCLQENCWKDENKTLTKRWYIVDTHSADVRYVAQCYQAHTKAHLQSLLKKRGFKTIKFYTSLSEDMDLTDSDFIVVLAEKCKIAV